MADWRALGCVPDSDDDDDSTQASGQFLIPSTEDGFRHIDDIGKAGEHEPGDRTEELLLDGPYIPKSKTEKFSIRKDGGQSFDGTAKATHGTQSLLGRFVAVEIGIQKPSIPSQQVLADEDIDELQQDHYEQQPAQGEAALFSSFRDSNTQLAIASPSRVATSFRYLSSSPLTEPPPTPDFRSQSLRSEKITPEIEDQPLSASPVHSSDPHDLPVRDGEEVCSDREPNTIGSQKNQPLRTLRRRNPIQLHPYAIEDEKYRQVLKARGIKPLRITEQQELTETAITQNTDEVYLDADKDSQPSCAHTARVHQEDAPVLPRCSSANDHVIVTSSLSLPNQTIVDSSPLSNTYSLRVEDEFPDINELLQSHHPHAIAKGFKRQKVLHTFSRNKLKRPGWGEMDNEIPPIMPLSDVDNLMSDMPPSLPQSTPLKPNHPRKQQFRFLRQISPPTLPTPAISSELRPRSVTNLAETLTSSIEYSTALSNEDDHCLTDHSNSPSVNTQSHQLERAQRKIRGVLPASWLKLDLKNQESKIKPRARLPKRLSPDSPGEHRGVARPATGSRMRDPESPLGVDFPISLSEDEGSDSSSEGFVSNRFSKHRLQKKYESNKPDKRPPFISADIDEVLEDNKIDEMIPSVRRLKPISYRQKGIQTKLAKGRRTKPQNLESKLSKRSQASPAYQSRITDRFQQSHKKKPPRLSILDIPAPDRPVDRPPFVRVASRTAKLRRDKGRHSPTSKYMRLATIDDTKDAVRTLRDWRQGTIAPRAMLYMPRKEAFLDRRPLHPRSANEQPLSPAASVLGTLEGNQILSSEARPSPPRPRPSGNRGGRNSLRNLMQRQPPNKVDARGKVGKLDRVRNRNHGARKRGHLITSMQNLSDSRPAALERLEGGGDRINPERAFHQHISNIANGMEQSQASNVLLRRFLDLNPPSSTNTVQREPPFNKGQNLNETALSHERPAAKVRTRKSRPKRINVDKSIYHIGPLSASTTAHAEDYPPINQQEKAIIGLEPFGTRYTCTFDVGMLPSRVFLHASTFVGSGKFYRSLNSSNLENMDEPRGFSILRTGIDSVEFGPWTDSVSTQLGNVFDNLLKGLDPSAVGNDNIAYQRLLSSQMDIIGYFSDHLSFSDGVDRISCLRRCKALVLRLLEEIDSQYGALHEKHHDFCLQVRTLVLAFSNQLWQMCNHDLVPAAIKDEIRSLVFVTARQTLHLALEKGFSSLPRCLENVRHLEACDYGIRDCFSSIEAIIVTHHILRESTESLSSFWDIARDAIITQSSGSTVDFRKFELSWYKLFMSLPFLDFDTQGIIKTKQRFDYPNDDWPSVKLLLEPILSLYRDDCIDEVPTINSYFRALLGRCLHLINSWGWERCQLIIGTLFDFFARNSLAFLIREESHGSPGFLENLDQSQPLEPEPRDRSFHLFLKIVGSGLSRMRKIYPEKKIRDIVWRLMPNHGRQHPKDEAVSQRDLDALRNHHDLLCVLYWASPSSARPGPSLIRNLVRLESSHREACHINIRAWANLVRFQLSTGEAASALAPFAEWHHSLLEQLLSQHKYARTEAEEHVRSLKHTEHDITTEHLETTITRNQRQVAAVLGDALISLKIAIDASRSLECSHTLITPAVVSMFELFDARRSQSHQTIIQALEVVQAFIKQCDLNHFAKNAGSGNDESQDYGDWTAFTDTLLADDDLAVAAHHSPPVYASQLLETFHEPIKKLLSNCFGADRIPEDALLLKMTEVWVGVAQVLIRQDARSWDDYITQYGTDSWDRLRKTEQSRKFNSYYLALIIEANNNVYDERREFFLAYWIESLVERESLVKFQNRLTTALMNTEAKGPLLENLPFWKDSRLGRFDITVSEFLDRRLSLISTVLSNMRDSLEEGVRQRSEDLPIRRQTYKDLVRRIMATMKRNYLELGQGSNARGAYVGFVHRVVELLQQYTSEICPIDHFFIDALVFPLPTADPTYVVGRIKSYGLRLENPQTAKQLSVYLQSVFERTAADGQQNYLIRQLSAAMADSSEHGNPNKPTLRSFIVKAIVPAYLEVSLDGSIGWFIALPLLQAMQAVFCGLLGALDGASLTSVASVISIIGYFLCSAQAVMESLLEQTDFSERLQQSHILRLLGIIYSDITALLPVLDYIIRLAQPTLHTIPSIEFFKSFAILTASLLLQPLHTPLPTIPQLDTVTPPEESHIDIRAFTLRELRNSLSKNWVVHDGRYFLTRGKSQQEIPIPTMPFEDAKREFVREVESLFGVLAALPSFSSVHRGVHRALEKKGVEMGMGLGNLWI